MGDGEVGERSLVDTNIFLYAIQGHPEFGEASKRILERIDGEEEAVVSSITLAEICWWLEKHGKVNGMREEIDLILSIFNLDVVQLKPEDFLSSAELIREWGIDFNDCLNIAVMKRLGVDRIYSNDSDFDEIEWVKRTFE